MACTIHLYLLELSGGKYYVGQPDDVEASFLAHQLGTGLKWSKLYPPLHLAKTKTIEVPDLATALGLNVAL